MADRSLTRAASESDGLPYEAAGPLFGPDRKANPPARGTLGTLVTFVGTLARAAPGRLALALALALACSVTEGIGLVILIPLLNLMGVDVQPGPLGRLASVVDVVVLRLGVPWNLVGILSIYVLVVVVQASLIRWQAVTSASLQSGWVAALRGRLHRAVTRAAWLRLVRYRTADLAYALTGQAQRIGHGVHLLLRMALDLTVTTVYVLATLYVSPPVTALVVSAGLALSLLLRGQAQVATQLGQATVRMSADTYRSVLEHLGGLKTVRTYGAGEATSSAFADLARRMAGLEARTTAAQATTRWRFEVGAVVVLAAVLYLAIAVLATPAASLLILLYAFARVMPRVSMLHGSLQQLLSILPDFAASHALEMDLARHEDPRSASRGPLALRRELRLEAVSFRYASAAVEPREALTDVSLGIPAGRTTAIVGPSGAGKSTVADLLVGLVGPQGGRILVDGTTLAPEHTSAWRDLVGYVPQDTFLFHDTVRANLRWARPDAGEAEIWAAIRAAAAEFVEHLPEGLDTVLGDRGTRLSGGERQRLALARALLRRPAVLVLDEATSSLDAENERRIQGALEALHGHLTVVIITHRLTTVRSADVIHVLEAGRLVESGTWHSLWQDPRGRFRALCHAQGLQV